MIRSGNQNLLGSADAKEDLEGVARECAVSEVETPFPAAK